MEPFAKGRLCARIAETAADIARAQELRHLAFITGRGGASRTDGRDSDAFDDLCHHVLIEDGETGALLACFRLLPLRDGTEIGQSYSAQFYDLGRLSAYPGRLMEMGRFCIHPDHSADPDILRLAWGAMTRMVDETGVDLLFGCTSFHGTEAGDYRDAFALLAARHLAPSRWRPQVRVADVFHFAQKLRRHAPDPRLAAMGMPPLLRTYLIMGGWVSDHAVIDRDLNTLHVFTGLEIRAVPAARARALRAVAG